MRHFLMLPLLALFPLLVTSQDVSKLTDLNDEVFETSGLIFFDDRLITHNDDGISALFEINIDNGNVNRTVTIQNATNVDWEDMCSDDDYIYIGDIGNNSTGNRTDLKIYKLLKTDYLRSEQVSAEIIEFSYEDQIDFTPSLNNSNFDAGTLISFGSYLYVFTRNWVDRRTNIYKIPKIPGTYSVKKIDEFDADGLVAGGTYNPLTKKVILVGYSGIRPFAIELRGFSNGEFSNGVIDKYNLNIPLAESFQTEAITYSDASNYYFSAEKNALGNASLYSLTSNTLAIDDFDLIQNQIYPNPAGEVLSIETKIDLEKVEIYDYLGKLMLEDTSGDRKINISELPKGVYILKLHTLNRESNIKFFKE